MVDLRTKPLTRGQIGEFIGSERGIRSYENMQYDLTDQNDALVNATFLTLTSEPTLGSERIFTPATGLAAVDGGPGGPFTLYNTAPDQVVTLVGAGTSVVTGAYPNFTVTSTDSFVGTVTSVNASGGTTGLSFMGGPITNSGTLTLTGNLGVPNGGSGLTSFTANTIYKGNGSSPLAASQIADNGTIVSVGTAYVPTNAKFTVGGNRSYFAANSESYSIGVNYNTTTGTYYIGATNSATPDMLFSDSAGSVRMRIGHNGGAQVTSSLSVGNVTPTASGAGITFPSTASPSTDPNTLDDYREVGSVAATVSSSGGSIGAYTATWTYTKIGRVVLCTVTINISNNNTGSGFINCSLPFTAMTGASFIGTGREDSITGNQCQAKISSAGTTVAILDYASGYPGGGGTATARTIIVSGFYFV